MVLIAYILIIFSLQIDAALLITQAQARSCATQSDGNVVIGGIVASNNAVQGAIARFNSGYLDSSFGTGGLVAVSVGTRTEIQAVALQDSKIVAAGFALVDDVYQLLLLRYNTDGSPDTTFNTTGSVTQQIGDGAIAYAMSLDANGNIIVAGSTQQSGTSQFFVARYTSSGTLDNTFNSSGIIPGVIITTIGSSASGLSLIIQSDGNIVMAGSAAIDGQNQYAVARYTTAGTLDTTFGNNGITTTAIGSTAQGLGVGLQSDGSIIVAGFSDTAIALARYTSAGILDTTYGTNGIVTSVIGKQARAHSVVIDPNDNAVVVGFSDMQLAVMRYTSTGILDSSFAGAGQIIFYGGSSVGNAVTLQPDGSILAVGSGHNDYLHMRFTNTGSADYSWRNLGIVNQPTSNKVITISHTETVGTNGGTFTGNSWQTRMLNIVNPANNIINLINNQFILLPGYYSVQITAPAYQVGNHQIQLQNVTDGITQLWGSSAFSGSKGSATNSTIDDSFILSRTTTFEIQHRGANTQNSDGFGIAAGFGSAEIYTTLRITPH